ncbi:glycosyltransferase family 4 protein [Geobacter anodireducens]
MKNKINILMVIRWPVGGIRTFIRYVYRNFNSNQWKFTLIVPKCDEGKVLRTDLCGYDVKFVELVEQPTIFELVSSVAVEVKSCRYHLIHSHGFTSGVCSYLGSVFTRLPHIMTSHDVINYAQFAGIKGKVKRKMMSLIFNRIDIIQSVSYDAQDNLFEYFPCLKGKMGKCVVVGNGIDVERFLHTPKRDLRSELNISNDVFLIGFFGRFMSQKGFSYLVDALYQLKKESKSNKKPLVLTFGHGGYIREEIENINNLGLNEYFKFMPFTDNIAGAIKGVDVVVMPSLWEACGLLAMETLVAGIPLIASTCIGLREVVRGTPAYTIPAKDSRALLQAIYTCMAEERQDTFKDYIDDAVERFDSKRQSREIQELILRLIS